jgi:hypothetical protein
MLRRPKKSSAFPSEQEWKQEWMMIIAGLTAHQCGLREGEGKMQKKEMAKTQEPPIIASFLNAALWHKFCNQIMVPIHLRVNKAF